MVEALFKGPGVINIEHLEHDLNRHMYEIIEG